MVGDKRYDKVLSECLLGEYTLNMAIRSTENPKVLYIVEAMGGGVFTYLVDLANELVDQFDMYIAYATRPQTPADFKEYFDSRIHLIKVQDFTRSINLRKDLKALQEIKRIAASVKPDIIHLHSSKAGALGRFAFDGKKTPIFYTPHGYSFLMQDYKPTKRALFKAIESVCAKRHCTTISCSEGEHQESLKLTRRATYVNNGINVKKMDRILEGIKPVDHPFTVFTLGRICYQKNPALFNQIAETMPETQFLWIGDGEMREVLTAPNIKISGWVNRKEALSMCLNADVFLLTSLWEGLPISLLESMYMRKLCVVNDVIGNHDVIHNGINGFVCRDVHEFVQAIRTSEAEQMVIAAYDDIETQYNTVVMAERYAKIYREGYSSKNKLL